MARTRATDYEDKQRHILDTAAAVVTEAGMDKSSMAEIARQAGVSKALLYHYYQSKDELIFDIVRRHLLNLDTAIEKANNPELEPNRRLGKLIAAVIDQYENADKLHQVQLSCMGKLPSTMTEQLRDIDRQIVRRFAEVISDINPKLTMDRHQLMPVTMTLFGTFNWIYMWFREDGELSREDYATLLTSLFLNGVTSL